MVIRYAIQPLRPQQVDTHLEHIGEALALPGILGIHGSGFPHGRLRPA